MARGNNELSPMICPVTDAEDEQVLAPAPRLTASVAAWRDPGAVLRAVKQWVAGSPSQAGSGSAGLLVAEVDGRVVGFVSIATRRHFTGEEDAYVGELIVDSAARRHCADECSRGVGAPPKGSTASRWKPGQPTTPLAGSLPALDTRRKRFDSQGV